MGRPPDGPRIKKRGKKFYIHYYDYAAGKTVRKACSALKARNKDQRKQLLQDYEKRAMVIQDNQFAANLLTNYDCKARAALALYLRSVRKRRKNRLKGIRDPRLSLAEASVTAIRFTISALGRWLRQSAPNLTTGQMSGTHLSEFFSEMAVNPDLRIRSDAGRAAATESVSGHSLNQYRRIVKTALRYLDDVSPALFPRFKVFQSALKANYTQAPEPVAYEPKQLTAAYRAAAKRDDPHRQFQVTREHTRGRKARFVQTTSVVAATPVSRLFLLLALTGMRRSEALGLKWKDVELAKGRIAVRSSKTGKTRTIPLTGDVEHELAPEFLSLLRRWKLEAGDREYVLPHEGTDAPRFNKKTWKVVCMQAGVPDLCPQRLRQNFVSYCRACGVPADSAAKWAGHSTAVAERHYAAQVLDRNPGKSIEEAMGFADLLKVLVKKEKHGND